MVGEEARGRGWFVTLEGPEGSGKTTQSARLREHVLAAGLPGPAPVFVREPGGTQLGEGVRRLLLEADALDVPPTPQAEALLFNVSRAELVRRRIEPALAAGSLVVCDRYGDSTIAYQGYGHGLPLGELRAVVDFATGGLVPDLTILLDVPTAVGIARKPEADHNRFEADFGARFHDRVREGFLAMAAAAPDRWVVLDATAPPEDVLARIVRAIARLPGLEPLGRRPIEGPAVARSPLGGRRA